MRQDVLVNGISLYQELQLRQLVLVFDHILVTEFQAWDAWSTVLDRHYVNDFGWLHENGYIQPAIAPPLEEVKASLSSDVVFTENYEKLAALREETQIVKALEWMQQHDSRPANDGRIPREEANFARFMNRGRHYFTVMQSIALNRLEGQRTVPLMPSAEAITGAGRDSRGEVLQVILRQLPVPDDSVPWEEVIAFREEPDTKYFLAKMRNWAAETAKGGLSAPEVAEKIEWLGIEYDRHVKLSGMRMRTGTLEFIVAGMADLAEDLVRVRWGRVARRLFSFRQRVMDKIEAETNAPGSEVAFISKAKSRFQR